MKKDGLADATIETTTALLIRLDKKCDMSNPEEVRTTLALQTWQTNTKNSAATTYDRFLKYLGGTWNKTHYSKAHGLPFIPTEKELDDLIAAGHPKTSTLRARINQHTKQTKDRKDRRLVSLKASAEIAVYRYIIRARSKDSICTPFNP